MTNLLKTTDNIFDIFFRDAFDMRPDSPFNLVHETKVPYPLDVYYDDDGLHIDIAVVSFDKDDVDVTVENDVLRISAKRSSDEGRADTKYVVKNISRKDFNIDWKVSAKYDLSKIKAGLEDGLLRINVPIAEDKKLKKIKII